MVRVKEDRKGVRVIKNRAIEEKKGYNIEVL